MALFDINTPPRNAPRASLVDLFRRVKANKLLRRRRRELAALSDTLLSDLSVTRSHADSEATRPISDISGHWVRR